MSDNNASLTTAMSEGSNNTSDQRVHSVASKIRKYFTIAFLPALVFVSFIVGLFIKFDYIVILPGDTQDAGDFVEISGIEAQPTDSQALLTTAIVRQRPFLWEYLWLKYVDGDDELTPLEEFFPQETSAEEFAEMNIQEMTNSQDLARVMALELLGLAKFDIQATVAEVVEGSAADGILEPGDRVTSLFGKDVESRDDLVAQVGTASPGDEVEVVFDRMVDDEVEQITETFNLGSDPQDETRALMGISVVDAAELGIDEQIDDLDFDIEFDANDIGGPSAGLALTIELIDQLSEGDLLGGNDVAFTGTIRFGGAVGSVGGAPQKTVGVGNAGVKYFIIPEVLPDEDSELVDDFAQDKVEIIRVSNLDEALDALEAIGGEPIGVRLNS